MRLRQAKKVINKHFKGTYYRKGTLNKAIERSPDTFFHPLRRYYVYLHNIAFKRIEEIV